MAKLPQKNNKNGRSMLLGLGFDSDGHKRITTGPNFLLAGGSQETHEVMTEKVIKINEKITARGKTLETISHTEFNDIAHDVGLRQPEATGPDAHR